MMKTIFVNSVAPLFLVVLTFSFPHKGFAGANSNERIVRSLNASTLPQRRDLLEYLRDLADRADQALGQPGSSSLSQTEAELAMKSIYDEVYRLDLNQFQRDRIAAQHQEILATLASFREHLDQVWVGWVETRGFATVELANRTRDIYRLIRYAEDMIAETLNLPPQLRLAEGVNPSDLYNAGNVVTFRGGQTTSAAISRITTDGPSQFSHVGIFTDSGDLNNPTLVEALIEVGLISKPWLDAIKKGVYRYAIFAPHSDYVSGIMARGAEHLFQRAQSEKVLYNFTMSLVHGLRPCGLTYDNLFCSLAIKEAALVGSGGSLNLPAFPSALNLADKGFLAGIGVVQDGAPSTLTFAPGDMEIEPRFRLVAEWSDPSKTRKLRHYDLAADAVFRWINKEGYRFRYPSQDAKVWLLSRASKLLSKTEFGNDLITKATGAPIPENMTSSTIANIFMLDQTIKALVKKIERVTEDDALVNWGSAGRPLFSPKQINELLETYRRAQLDSGVSPLRFLRKVTPCDGALVP